MIRSFCKYAALLMYSCVFFVIALLVIGLIISSIYYLKDGVFNFPRNQIERAIVFGVIAGSAITLAAILFKLIDMFKIKKG